MCLTRRPLKSIEPWRRAAAVCALALIAAFCVSPRAKAQSGPDPTNAATWYARAIAAWQQFKQTSPTQYELLMNHSGDPAMPITPEVRAALVNVQGVFSNMRRAAQQEHCDFALDYSEGFELMLPHLGEMRGLARAMRADATVRLADGDSSGAANQLASMYRMAGHCGDDRVLISSLVGQAVFGLTDAGVQQGLDSAAFDAADSAALLAGATTLTAQDPFQYVEAVAMEQEIALATFEKYRGQEGAQNLAAMLGEPGADEAVAELGGLDDPGFDEALSQYDAYMTRVHDVFAMSDKDAALAEAGKLEEALTKGEYGPLAKMIAPAFSKALDTKFKGEQMLAERVAILSALAKGEQQPAEVANAALWYLRAIEMWEALPAEQRATLLALDVDVKNDVAAPIASALVDVQPVLDVMREASSKRRCVFCAFVHHHGAPAVAPHYLPGLHELLRVLRSDAIRLARAGDRDAASDRLTIVMRAVAHLGGAGVGNQTTIGRGRGIGDAQLACARAAHVNFNRTLDLIEAAQKATLLDADPTSTLADAAGRISRKDPFGYLDALTRTREAFLHQRYAPPAKDDTGAKEWERQTNIIQMFNADQIMYVLVIVDERMRRMIEAGGPPPVAAPGNAPAAQAPAWEPDDITLPETIERLTGIFDAKAVDAVRGQFDDIMPRLERDDWEFFVGQPVPPLARLTDGITRARADLRRATRLLLLPDEIDVPATQPQP